MHRILQFGLRMLLVMAMMFTVEAKTGSIYIDYHCEDLSLPQVEFHLYQLYELDTRLDYVPTSEFADLGDFDEFVDNDTWVKKALSTENFIKKNAVKPDVTQFTDDMGRAVVDDLDEGVYLLQFDKKNLDDMSYISDCVMVMLPGSVDGDEEWVQSVIPKVTSYDEASESLPGLVTLKVLKTWRQDNSFIRPDSVSIYLYGDGKIVDQVELSQDTEWYHVWEDMDAEVQWAVEEVPVPHYTSTVVCETYPNHFIFYVENVYDTEVGGGGSVGVGGGDSVAGEGYETEVEGDLAETGAMWLPVPVLLISGMILILIGLVLRKGKHEENSF